MTDEREDIGEKRPLPWLLRWLLPVYADRVGGQSVLVYTSFPKAFYFYLVWLPGFVVLGLNQMAVVPDTQLLWWMFGFCVLTYLVIAEDTSPMGFALVVLSVVTALVLYFTGTLDWLGADRVVTALKRISMTLDPPTLLVLNTFLLAVWVVVCLFALTWKKRELASLRRAKLRPPLGRRPLPIVGRVVDNKVRDVFELILGFGAYDVEISYPGGQTIEIDKNCVGLALKLRLFNDIISRIPTIEEEAAAAEDVGEVGA
ncbi:MAG: hypothetical protein AB1726_12460 [Planctomycetota bacterium]